MGVISRGIRNAFRNIIRTFSITFILALSIAMSLVMLLALKTVQAKIDSVKGSIGNTITVSPAGVRGFEGGGDLLTAADLSTIASVPNVTNAVSVMTDRMNTNQDTNLQSAIDPGTFGGRQRQRNGETVTPDNGSGGANRNGSTNVNRTFTMPITVTATSDLNSLASLSVGSFNITTGSKFDPSVDQNVALVGTDLAAKNNLSVGSTFKAYNTDVTVAGIFDTGNKFTNSAVVMPLKTVQRLSGQTDQFNSIIVQASSIDSLSSVQSAIKDKLGSKADVVSQQDTSNQAIAPLQNIKTISLYSLIGSVVAGSIIIFLTMLMIVRERRREIGVLKAIGSSNLKIVSQFTVESLALTVMSSAIGIILGFIFSNPVLKVLINNSEAGVANAAPGQGARGGGMFISRLGGGLNNARDALQNLHAVVGWEIILYGVLAAIAIAVIGSANPAFIIAKVRPAEVMRAE